MTHETRRSLLTFALAVAVFAAFAAIVRVLRPHIAGLSIHSLDGQDEPTGRPATGPTNNATQPAPMSAFQRTAHLRPPRVRPWRLPALSTTHPTPGGPERAAEFQAAVRLQIARAALEHVGADDEADEIWVLAINDPAMPAEARSYLIEDLNYYGFADPENLTTDDLPLIVNRIALIEELAPDAMDEVNADAFAAAYKDLVSLYEKLAPPPPQEPVAPGEPLPVPTDPGNGDLPAQEGDRYTPVDSL